jgi:hypothetical protein
MFTGQKYSLTDWRTLGCSKQTVLRLVDRSRWCDDVPLRTSCGAGRK